MTSETISYSDGVLVRRIVRDFTDETVTEFDGDGSVVLSRAFTQAEKDEIAAVRQAEIQQAALDAKAVSLRTRAKQALATNAAYLAQPEIPASPTLAQLTAAVKVIRAEVDALARQADALIRLELAELDDISDT